MNKYTAQGTKDIEDVLIKAVDVYNSILGGDDDEEMGDDDDEPDEVEIEIDDADLLKGDDEPIEVTKKEKGAFSQQEIEDFKKRFPSRGKNESAVNCIMTEYLKLKHNDTKKYGFSAEPCGDDIFTWDVRLFGFEIKEDEVAKDLVEYKKKYGQDYIQMEMKFTEGFPLEPPFIRVLKPRFKFRTGHVTIGGSICMQLLTKSGWSPVNTIESIFVQIRCEIASGGARLDFDNISAYTEHEAREAYHRVASRYGWDNPNYKPSDNENFDH
jgi:ubiquitin-conjugating enzyme E2 Q